MKKDYFAPPHQPRELLTTVKRPMFLTSVPGSMTRVYPPTQPGGAAASSQPPKRLRRKNGSRREKRPRERATRS